MQDFLRGLPKAELHLHLEGSVEPETLHELDPSTPVEEFRALYRYDDFDGFLKAFGAIGKRLRLCAHHAPAALLKARRRSRIEVRRRDRSRHVPRAAACICPCDIRDRRTANLEKGSVPSDKCRS